MIEKSGKLEQDRTRFVLMRGPAQLASLCARQSSGQMIITDLADGNASFMFLLQVLNQSYRCQEQFLTVKALVIEELSQLRFNEEVLNKTKPQLETASVNC